MDTQQLLIFSDGKSNLLLFNHHHYHPANHHHHIPLTESPLDILVYLCRGKNVHVNISL
jgi:hypothetical protein